MNHKSTENLIESGGSVEEVFVPPLDLKSNNDKLPEKLRSNSINSESDRHNDEHQRQQQQKRAKNSFLVDKSSLNESDSIPSNPPIPAARKFSLPPIATKRNGKDVKENSNQLTRKQSIQSNDTIRIVNERPKTRKPNPKSDSDSDIQTVEQFVREKENPIELTSFAKETRKRFKRQFASHEVNEETTSFISYEEKHEKEDNSEHSISNHSSVNSKVLQKDANSGVLNEAFTKDEENQDKSKAKGDEIEDEIQSKSKSKKHTKKTKKSKEKRKKRTSRNTEQTSQQIQAAEEEEDETQEAYDFKRVIGNETISVYRIRSWNSSLYNISGVWIHETSALRFDPSIRQPRVRVSIYNLNDGDLLSKSNPLRNAVLNYEPTNVTFIQPILSNRCAFKESRYQTITFHEIEQIILKSLCKPNAFSQIECDWNNELLIINEDIRHIQKFHVIIFFEIMDILSTSRSFELNGKFQTFVILKINLNFFV